MSDAIVEAIQDLTRVTIALSGNFVSKSEAVRKLVSLSIPSARIAAILAMPVTDVSSIIAKDKKKKPKGEG
jgi:Arc/MetJ-type ribon-helix-helix transcriptional regulator